ncbi:MAG: hypothetical protein QNJ22_00315 [Desulfosarcinaceae bacterium]|nr:hypothetical protein [Desulfosarcinaceae bacterium]
MRRTWTTADAGAPIRLRVRIDRLQLPFTRAARRRQMADALREELVRLFSQEMQTPATPPNGHTHITASPLKLSRPLEPAPLGRRVARHIYQQCTRGDNR